MYLLYLKSQFILFLFIFKRLPRWLRPYRLVVTTCTAFASSSLPPRPRLNLNGLNRRKGIYFFVCNFSIAASNSPFNNMGSSVVLVSILCSMSCISSFVGWCST